MTANRLLRMVLNRLFRVGAQRVSKGKRADRTLAQAKKSVRTINRLRRM